MDNYSSASSIQDMGEKFVPLENVEVKKSVSDGFVGNGVRSTTGDGGEGIGLKMVNSCKTRCFLTAYHESLTYRRFC